MECCAKADDSDEDCLLITCEINGGDLVMNYMWKSKKHMRVY